MSSMITENALVDFIKSLFDDEKKAADFAENPGKCLNDVGLGDVTSHEVSQAITVAAQSVPSPSGGGMGWTPSIPDHGSPAQILQQVTNNYYQQISNTTIIGDNNTVETTQTSANGDGSVAVGGDAHGPIATTGGVAGNDNEVGNKTDDHTIDVDKSVHGNNSGNAQTTDIADNSSNDSHNKVGVTTAPTGPGAPPVAVTTPPIQPTVGIDPAAAVMTSAQLTGGESFAPFDDVPTILPGEHDIPFIADPAPDSGSDTGIPDVADPGHDTPGDPFGLPGSPDPLTHDPLATDPVDGGFEVVHPDNTGIYHAPDLGTDPAVDHGLGGDVGAAGDPGYGSDTGGADAPVGGTDLGGGDVGGGDVGGGDLGGGGF
ncbi:IniB N-terminal domain-containing protein [Gordonia sp. NPDC003376]